MDMLAAVTARLAALGYSVTVADRAALPYAIAGAEDNIKGLTNQEAVPQELHRIWADMAAGLFLADKKAVGALDGCYDFSAPTKSITEGDTSVTYALSDAATAEARFDELIRRLIKPEKSLIARYRRLIW